MSIGRLARIVIIVDLVVFAVAISYLPEGAFGVAGYLAGIASVSFIPAVVCVQRLRKKRGPRSGLAGGD